MSKVNLKKELSELCLPDDDKTLKTFDSYMEAIIEWNEKVNLTAIVDRDDFIEKHYIDSLQIAKLNLIKPGLKVIDIGTGGGFPGIPLAIAYPDTDFILADSLNKRLKIIEKLTEKLAIGNAQVLHARAEDIGKSPEYREVFDCSVSRAVANLATLCEYCLPMVKVGGNFVAYKSGNIDEEIKSAEKAIKILGGGKVEVFLADKDKNKHCLVKITKIKSTPNKYPRKAGTPSKQPL